MATTVLPINMIVQDPEIRGGKAVVAGTSLRVSDIAVYHVPQGLSPGELAEQFNLELAQVHAALCHYFSHRSEIDAEILRDAAEAERWKTRLIDKGVGDVLA